MTLLPRHWVMVLIATVMAVTMVAVVGLLRDEPAPAIQPQQSPPVAKVEPRVVPVPVEKSDTEKPQFPSYQSEIPSAFRGRWDEITDDGCESREARFYLGGREFMNFEVQWEVAKVKLYSATEIDIHTTAYDENKNQVDEVWEFKLVDDGASLTSRKPGGTFFKRCPEAS